MCTDGTVHSLQRMWQMAISSDKTDNYGFSILDMDPNKANIEEIPAFYRDLNLDQVIEKLTLRWGREVAGFFRSYPDSPEEAAYRRAIYGDIKKEAVYEALLSFIEDLNKTESLRREKEKVMAPIQKAVWHVREIGAYCEAYEALESRLSSIELSSAGLNTFLNILRDILDSGGYRKMKERSDALMRKIRKLRFVIIYDKDRMQVEVKELEGEGAYEEMLKRERNKEIRHLQNPFRADSMLNEIEAACLEIVLKKKPDFFNDIMSTAEETADYEKPVLKRFEKEIIFYISFCSMQRELMKEGLVFSTPKSDMTGRMEATGLYDLALAQTSLYTDKEVVSNDFYYDEGERFFVLTGPNQGGKTTFARSLGQLVFLSNMGLDVPASSANVWFFPNIQTHFSVEESVETGKGKLKEELTRLSPMMGENRKGTFVIINELFTTAANYDAQIMGKTVLSHFIDLGCMGIYVTHIAELSEGREGIVSLRAGFDENKTPTFKILRGAPDDSACAEKVVSKYRLSYDQLKERL